MKKLLTLTALATVLSLGAEAKFQGSYAGVSTSYRMTKIKTKDTFTTANRTTNRSFSLSSPEAGLDLGYGENFGDVYVAGDLHLGYTFSSKKTTTVSTTSIKAKSGLNALLGAKVGGHIADDFLAYGYLGLGMQRFELKASQTSGGKIFKKHVNSWSVVPGLGMSYKMTPNTYVDLGYKYAMAFKTEKPRADVSYDKKPKTHIISLGVGYQF